MREQIKAFLTKLNLLFPLEGKRIEPVLETYTDILLEKCLKTEYDFKKLTSYIVQNYKYQSFPTAKYILDCLPMAEIRHFESVTNEGDVIIVTLPSGMMYSFTVTGYGKELRDIKNKLQFHYGKCEINRYPKGTVLIGDRVIEP